MQVRLAPRLYQAVMIKHFFRGRQLVFTLLVIIGALVMGRLGIWQLDRLAQRQAINSAIQARRAEPPVPLTPELAADTTQEYRRVEITGIFDTAQEVVLRNRTLDGATGVHVLTPLRFTSPAGTPLTVLVDRGWLPNTFASATARAPYAAPGGEVLIIGQIRRSQEDFGGPADPPFTAERPRLDAWFRVDIPRITQQVGYPLLPIFVEQLPSANDAELPRPDPLTDLGQGPHLGYAIQWFAFAVILLVGYIAFIVQRQRRADVHNRLQDN